MPRKKKKKTEGKVPFPEMVPTITLPPLTMRLLHDFDKYSNGKMLMKFADTEIRFEDDKNKKIKGSVGAAMGGTIYVEIGGRCWAMSPMDLVQAVFNSESTRTDQ